MVEVLKKIFSSDGFIPHGHCLLWNQGIILLHVVSDSIITLAYYSIPIIMLYFVHKRRDLAFPWMFLMFGAFIFGCGTTHLMGVLTLWVPTYWLDGVIKAATALFSLATAVLLVPLVPKALSLRSPAELEVVNRELEKQITERGIAEERLQKVRDELEIQVQERTVELSKSNEELKKEITERRQADEARLASEERYRALFENMIEGYAYCKMLFEHDQPQDFIYVDVNPAFEALTGLKDIVGQKITQVIPGIKESNPELFEIYGRVALTGKPERFETYLPALGIWFSISAFSPAKGYFVAVFDNITERKRAEAELRQSEERFRLLVEGVKDYAIFTLDKTGRVVSWNLGAERIKGYREKEIIGQHFSRFYPDADVKRGKPEQELAIAVKKGEFHEEGRRVHKDGSQFIADVTITALFDKAGELRGFSKVTRDITESKRAEEEILRLKAELEQRVIERTAELEAINKELEAFSYSVSHDLRAPLRAIDGFSRFLFEDYSDILDDEGRRMINVIRQNTLNMGRLIDDLLSFSRLGRQEVKQSQIDMGELARAVFEELKPDTHERTIQLNINALPPACGDRAMIHQVFVNLLSNAIKFTKPKELAVVEVGSWVGGGENIYYVRDNGVGFDMQYVGKLFGVFQRLHRQDEFEGTGVGLALVKRIIHRHGGRVWAEGKMGEGATFYFTLPGLGQ